MNRAHDVTVCRHVGVPQKQAVLEFRTKEVSLKNKRSFVEVNDDKRQNVLTFTTDGF